MNDFHISENDFQDYFDDNMSKNDRDYVESHVDCCYSCYENYDNFKAVFSKSAYEVDEVLSENFAQKVMNTIYMEQTQKKAAFSFDSFLVCALFFMSSIFLVVRYLDFSVAAQQFNKFWVQVQSIDILSLVSNNAVASLFNYIDLSMLGWSILGITALLMLDRILQKSTLKFKG